MSATSLAKKIEIGGSALIMRYGLLMVILFACTQMTCEASDVVCEDLPAEWCAYSISSMGARCVLVDHGEKDGDNTMQVYRCQTSSVETKVKGGWIEAEECIEACGLDRMTVGLFSQPAFDPRLFCSSRCSRSCSHLHDLLRPLHEGRPGSSSADVDDVCFDGDRHPHLLELELKIHGGRALAEVPSPAPSPSPISG
ncbi:hypothetical protein GOP47_0020622 [Adiantum capillus-veneris]|uniref:PAR1 protein n=1 Tax=Adiantum capillus-veneris TaxID=13818 RepID=A0A9D4Z7X0_ADICA|nr:hypothetical protein GOP47_0020622 [Adiantum capillus-veneris]